MVESEIMVKYHDRPTEDEGLALVIPFRGSGVIPATSHRGKAFFFWS